MVASTSLHLTPSIVLADWVIAWLVPIALGVLVLVAAWIGVRWSYSEHLGPLATVPLFGGLSPRQLRSLARAAARVEFAPGGRILREGEPVDGFYLMQEGNASVTVAGDRKAELDAGGYFGEMAVIDGGPRTASITAETNVTVLKVPSSTLLRLIDRDPAISRSLAAELQGRLRDAGGVVPASKVDPPTRDALIELCTQLRMARQPDWGQAPRVKRRWLRF